MQMLNQLSHFSLSCKSQRRWKSEVIQQWIEILTFIDKLRWLLQAEAANT